MSNVDLVQARFENGLAGHDWGSCLQQGVGIHQKRSSVTSVYKTHFFLTFLFFLCVCAAISPKKTKKLHGMSRKLTSESGCKSFEFQSLKRLL